jgi:hypothetical protein
LTEKPEANRPEVHFTQWLSRAATCKTAVTQSC